jgi:hypothetical protein
LYILAFFILYKGSIKFFNYIQTDKNRRKRKFNLVIQPTSGLNRSPVFRLPPIASLHWGLFNLKTFGLPLKKNPALGEAILGQDL